MKRPPLVGSLLVGSLLLGLPGATFAQEGTECDEPGVTAEPDAVTCDEPEIEPAPAAPRAKPAPKMGYELRHFVTALKHEGLIPERNPDGKTVAWVRTFRFPVFVPAEPFPTFFNALHVTTTEPTVLAEVLLQPGDVWDRARAEETARNLRQLSIFNVVGVVPVKIHENPEQIGLLVVTRDLWSLRVESRIQFTGDYLDNLLVQLTERNLLGRDKRASARFQLEPLDYALGAVYVDPRLAGQKLRMVGTFDARFARETDEFDGVQGYLEVGRPLYDLRQPWGFSVVGNYEQFTMRQAQRGELVQWVYPDGCDVDDVEAGCQTANRTWDHRFVGAAALGRIQRGDDWIVRVGAGAGFLRLDAETNAATALPVDPVARAAFADQVLPDERQWVYPTINARLFENRHQIYRDLAGFGLSEDVRLGPQIFVDARTPLSALGSTEDVVDMGGHLSWRAAWAGDGLIDLAVGARVRLDLESGETYDRRYLARIRGATPSLGFGRFVLRADWLGQGGQRTPDLVTLGGDNGLRGYPSQYLFAFGADRVRGNVEFRTAPYIVSFLHFGAVAFFDAGSIYTDAEDFALRSSAGLGLRMVVPQASPLTYRLDFGVPTDGSIGFFVNVGFETTQAVPITGTEDGLYEFSVGGLTNQP